MTTYRWVRHEDQKLYDVGVLNDGSLHNPRGYPEDIVRVALAAADGRWRERRSQAAKKAAQTRRSRVEKKSYEVADRIIAGHVFGPSPNCAICGRGLGDKQSFERGIGSECWQGVLERIRRSSNTFI